MDSKREAELQEKIRALQEYLNFDNYMGSSSDSFTSKQPTMNTDPSIDVDPTQEFIDYGKVIPLTSVAAETSDNSMLSVREIDQKLGKWNCPSLIKR